MRNGNDTLWQRRIVLGWTLFAAIAVLWDFSWCFVFRDLRSPAASHDWRIIWTTYGLVDHRFLRGDGYLLIIEMMTGFGSILHFYVAYQLLRGTTERARLALLVVSIMDIYGALIYFGAEALVGFEDIDTTSFVRTWILFVGLNSLWLIFPAWCIYLGTRMRGEKAPYGRRERRGQGRAVHAADVGP